MWVESGVVSMLLSSLNGDPVEIDRCMMVAQQSCKKTCRFAFPGRHVIT